jgi:hypothetical protein
VKAKYYMGVLSVLLLSGMPVIAQYPHNPYHTMGRTPVIVNNYYDGNDYYSSVLCKGNQKPQMKVLKGVLKMAGGKAASLNWGLFKI